MIYFCSLALYCLHYGLRGNITAWKVEERVLAKEHTGIASRKLYHSPWATCFELLLALLNCYQVRNFCHPLCSIFVPY